MQVWLATVGLQYAGVPYAVLALWTDRWLRRTPGVTRRAVWRRAMLLPAQLIPLYAVWEIGKALVARTAVWEGLVGGVAMGLTWVLYVGYAYVGLACVITRVVVWAGCVRAPGQAPAT